MKESKGLKRLGDIAYYLAFTAIFVFLIWKCRYGFANRDESFYLTIPYRLCMGDGLFIHEWHLSQMASLLLYPVMKVYLALFQSTEGILLYFRWIFTVAWSATALFIGYRLSHFSKLGSRVAALAVLIYTPFGIMALSYNSLGIMTLLCACVILITARTHRKAQYTISGALYACSVLCCPFNLVIYALFTVVSLLFAARGMRQLLRYWLFVTLGSFIVFCVFCAFVFSRCPLSDLPKLVPWLLDDPEHSGVSFLEKVKQFISDTFARDALTMAVYVIAAILILLGRIRKSSRPICFAVICLAIIAFLFHIDISNAYLNYIMYPMMLMGVYCAVTCPSRAIRLMFWGLWFQGFLYSFLLTLSSNQRFYAISSATTLSTAAGIVMAVVYVHEMKEAHVSVALQRVMLVGASLLFVVQIGMELQLRYTSVFWESQSMPAQTLMVEEGPEKGILVTQDKMALCDQLSDSIRPIKEDGKIQNVLFATKNTMSYLYAEKGFATYSAWLSGVTEASVRRMDAYYGFNPEKLPDVVYMEDAGNAFYGYFAERGYVPEEFGSWLYMRKPS